MRKSFLFCFVLLSLLCCFDGTKYSFFQNGKFLSKNKSPLQDVGLIRNLDETSQLDPFTITRYFYPYNTTTITFGANMNYNGTLPYYYYGNETTNTTFILSDDNTYTMNFNQTGDYKLCYNDTTTEIVIGTIKVLAENEQLFNITESDNCINTNLHSNYTLTFGTNQTNYTDIIEVVLAKNDTMKFKYDNETAKWFISSEYIANNDTIKIIEKNYPDNVLALLPLTVNQGSITIPEYIMVDSTSFSFSSTCEFSISSFKIGDRASIDCNDSSMYSDSTYTCNFNTTLDDGSYGNQTLILNTDKVFGEIYVSAAFNSSLNITFESENCPGNCTLKMNMDNFYVKNITSFKVQKNSEEAILYSLEGDTPNCTISNNTITFAIDLSEGDRLNVTQLISYRNVTLDSVSFDIPDIENYFFVTGDNSTITLNITEGTGLGDSIEVVIDGKNKTCTKNDESYTCNDIQVSAPQKLSITVGPDTNKYQFFAYVSKYTITDTCQTIFEDKEGTNNNINLVLTVPDDMANETITAQFNQTVFVLTDSNTTKTFTIDKSNFTEAEGNCTLTINNNTYILGNETIKLIPQKAKPADISHQLNDTVISLELKFDPYVSCDNLPTKLILKKADNSTLFNTTECFEGNSTISYNVTLNDTNTDGTYNIYYEDDCEELILYYSNLSFSQLTFYLKRHLFVGSGLVDIVISNPGNFNITNVQGFYLNGTEIGNWNATNTTTSESNTTYTFNLTNISYDSIQFKYSIGDGNYTDIPNGTIRYVEKIEDVLNITNLTECNYYAGSNDNVNFTISSIKEGETALVDINTISVRFNITNNSTVIDPVNGYYYLSDDIRPTYLNETQKQFTVSFIENDDIDNPLSSKTITFGTFTAQPYYFYEASSGITLKDLECLFENIEIQKDSSDPINLNCTVSDLNNTHLVCNSTISDYGDYYFIVNKVNTTSKSFISTPLNSTTFDFTYPNNVLVPGENEIKMTSSTYYMPSINTITFLFNNSTQNYTQGNCTDYCFTIEDQEISFNVTLSANSTDNSISSLTRNGEEGELENALTKQLNVSLALSNDSFGLTLENQYFFLNFNETEVIVNFTFANNSTLPLDIATNLTTSQYESNECALNNTDNKIMCTIKNITDNQTTLTMSFYDINYYQFNASLIHYQYNEEELCSMIPLVGNTTNNSTFTLTLVSPINITHIIVGDKNVTLSSSDNSTMTYNYTVNLSELTDGKNPIRVAYDDTTTQVQYDFNISVQKYNEYSITQTEPGSIYYDSEEAEQQITFTFESALKGDEISEIILSSKNGGNDTITLTNCTSNDRLLTCNFTKADNSTVASGKYSVGYASKCNSTEIYTSSTTINVIVGTVSVSSNMGYAERNTTYTFNFTIDFTSKENNDTYFNQTYINDTNITCQPSANYTAQCSYTIDNVTGPQKLSLYFTSEKLFSQDLYIITYSYLNTKECYTFSTEEPMIEIASLTELTLSPSINGVNLTTQTNDKAGDIYNYTIVMSSNFTTAQGNYTLETGIDEIKIESLQFSTLKTLVEGSEINVFYDNDQPIDLKLTFNQVLQDDDISSLLIFANNSTVTPIWEALNNALSINEASLSCTVAYNFTKDTNYTLYYRNQCNENIKLIDFTAKDPSLMKSYFPGSLKKGDIIANKTISIEFFIAVNATVYENVTLTNTMNSTNVIVLNRNTTDNSTKVVKFNVGDDDKDELRYGTYSAQLQKANSTEDVSNTLLIYDKELNITTKEVHFITGTSIFGTSIETSNVLEMTRLKLNLTKDNEIKELAFNIANDNKIMILSNTTLTNGNWTLTIQDLATNSTNIPIIVHPIPTINLTPKSNITEPFVVVNNTTFPNITFTFSDDFEYPELFKSVNATSLNFTFVIANNTLEYSGNYNFTESFITTNDTLDFYYDDNLYIRTNNTILFIHSDNIPKVKNNTTEITFTNHTKQVSVSFESLPQNYTNYIAVTLNNTNTFNFDIDKDSLILTFVNEITEDFIININLFNEMIRITAIVSQCDEFMVNDENGGCTTCELLNITKPFVYINDLGEYECIDTCPNSTKIYGYKCLDECPNGNYTQGNTCVDKCSSGYGIPEDKVNDTLNCTLCSENEEYPYYQDGLCLKGCADGLVRNELYQCVIPEVVLNNTCDNYCIHGSCEINLGIPICTCSEGYYGLTCNFTIDNLEDIIKTNIIHDVGLDLSKDNNTIQIKHLAAISVQINYTTFEEKINEETQKKIIEVTNSQIENIEKDETEFENKNKQTGVVNLIGLSLSVYAHQIVKHQKNDNLNEFNKTEFESLTTKAHEMNKKYTISGEFISENSEMIKDASGYLTYQRWSSNAKSSSSGKKTSKDNISSFVNYAQAIKSKYPNDPASTNYIYATTTINQKLSQLIHNVHMNTLRNLEESSSSGVQVSVFREGETQELTFDQTSKVNIYLPLTDDVNAELYHYYQTKGIDIYNPNDKAFTEPCYYNDNLDYDLTQKYRRTSLYQNKTFTAQNCNYTGYELDLRYISLECKFVETGYNYIVIDKELELENDLDHVDNLPTKCGGSIDSLSNNIAFWLFLVFVALFIIVDILLIVASSKKLNENNIDTAIQNDELYEGNPPQFFHQINNTENVKAGENDKVVPEEIRVEIPSQSQLSFVQLFMKNLSSLHPIGTLFKTSILMPIIFNTWIFVYNLFNLFGFNALYFNETMIEDRITDSFRNNFGYPMKTEFEKIMAAIATSIALTIIVRAINLVTISQKTDLSTHLINAKSNEEKQNVIDNFSKSYLVRRIISGIFMLALMVFFYYYCVVFCGIYTNTQYGWFYSGIWALFLNWVVFAPFYIFIISLVESTSGNTPCVYYMKKLFVF